VSAPYGWRQGSANWVIQAITNGTLYPYTKESKIYLCPTFYLVVRDVLPETRLSYSTNNRDKDQGAEVTQIGGMRAPAFAILTVTGGAFLGVSGGTAHDVRLLLRFGQFGKAGAFELDAGFVFF
jgi:hypothetical protein